MTIVNARPAFNHLPDSRIAKSFGQSCFQSLCKASEKTDDDGGISMYSRFIAL
ncbi:hypothetical protein [Methylobacterium soli]|uniref:hypothetical protein n=1 Tax=Methylobacterium soli TaxID=553447 RepID=UPI00177EC3AE|nr:hypothetical protein [Methylobacterium soli]